MEFYDRYTVFPAERGEVQSAVTVWRPTMKKDPRSAVWAGDDILSAGSDDTRGKIRSKEGSLCLDVWTEDAF